MFSKSNLIELIHKVNKSGSKEVQSHGCFIVDQCGRCEEKLADVTAQNSFCAGVHSRIV